MKPLSEKHQAFVRHYVDGKTVTEAARLAGYGARAGVTGSEILKRPDVIAEVQRITALRQDAERKRAEETVKAAVLTDTDLLKYLEEIIRDDTQSAADRTRAIALYGKHLGTFPEKLEHSGPAGGPLQVMINITRKV